MNDRRPRRTALSRSGAKDSSLALWTLREEQRLEPETLITTVTEAYARISMHGVRRELLVRQARAIGVPVLEIAIPVGCTNDEYERRMAAAFAADPLRDVDIVAFGDLFLADIRAYRETRMSSIGKEASLPLWHRDTGVLAREFIAAGFAALIVCLDPAQLDPSFAGRAFDEALLADLPPGVDPCGENGEFHTFVSAGPIFSAPLAIEVGETVERDGFVFTDVRAQPGAV